MIERPRQTWRCPFQCKWDECIHVCAERIRLVNAIITASLNVVEIARRLIKMREHDPMRGATEDELDREIDRYDAACAAQREGP